MATLKIGTWNIKNSYFNLSKNEKKAAAITELLDEEDLDILALQEVNPHLAAKIDEKLKKQGHEYRLITRYKKSKIKNLRVEYNMIISKNYAHTINEPIKLSSIPQGFNSIKRFTSIRERNINFQCIITPESKPSVLIGVTHLEHTNEELVNSQMDEVVNLTNSQMQTNKGLNTILAGNFNRKPTEKSMIRFTEQLSELGLQVVENQHNTYINHEDNQPVDYIVVPNDWEIDSVKTITSYDKISSHRPVIVEASTPKLLVLRKEM